MNREAILFLEMNEIVSKRNSSQRKEAYGLAEVVGFESTGSLCGASDTLFGEEGSKVGAGKSDAYKEDKIGKRLLLVIKYRRLYRRKQGYPAIGHVR